MELWPTVRTERERLADLLATLTPEQWAMPSLCAGWRVQDVAAHMVAAAETTPGKFTLTVLKHGLRFNAMVAAEVAAVGAGGPSSIASRLRAAAPLTGHPPGPATVMLGELVVHGEDLRRPLGVPGGYPAEALTTVADFYKKAGFPIGARKRISGLTLRATDVDWSTGSGPEVTGPAASLVLAMTGRRAGLSDLEGPGLATLTSRMP
ncbi:MAG TPA: maleylpyruvate isomerase family mycothiol-dependent enzyme [Acidimicrobiales bacterium]|nr:maleylpyruvate isomerase family mycothiol-dependent enzyme [Acidimicrobiales bacterium]